MVLGIILEVNIVTNMRFQLEIYTISGVILY